MLFLLLLNIFKNKARAQFCITSPGVVHNVNSPHFNHFKVYSSVTLSAFTVPCSPYHCLFLKDVCLSVI